MNRRATMSSTTANRSQVGTVIGLVALAAVALVVVLALRARSGPEPYDPASARPGGTAGLVEVLRRSAGSVSVGERVPAPGAADRVLILVDRLDSVQRAAIDEFMQLGGVVVVADPESTIGTGDPPPIGARASGRRLPNQRIDVSNEITLPPGQCDIAALADVRGLFVGGGALFDLGALAPASGCFARSGNAFVVVVPVGDGAVVRLGDADVWTNALLRRADNAALAVALLAPDQSTAVAVVLGTGTDRSIEAVGTGDERLVDLVPSWVWAMFVAGAVAFVAFALSRSVRSVKVLSEPVASPVPASELVVATGAVMERARHYERAGSVLRGRFRRSVAEQLGAELGAATDDLLARARHLGCDELQLAELRQLLDGEPIGNADALAELARRIERAAASLDELRRVR